MSALQCRLFVSDSERKGNSGGSQYLPKADDGKNGGAPRFRCMGNLAERQLSDLLAG
jgi:hypothetical protein